MTHWSSEWSENAPEEDVMEFMTVTGRFEDRRYIAIYRKWFNDKLSAWELELVPGTLRWLV
jgi:hypothetical protein